MDLSALSEAIAAEGFDGWLFFDVYERDPVAYRILGLPMAHASRRWFYYVPAAGAPRGLAHRVERTRLAGLPGDIREYSGWAELDALLPWLLEGARRIAMNYSPGGAIPAMSFVDGGTIDQVRQAGVEVGSAADLIQRFEALLDDDDYASHLAAAERLHRIKDDAFDAIGRAIRDGAPLDEAGVQRFILDRMTDEGLTTDGDVPICAVNANPANPHYFPPAEGSSPVQRGDSILIDLWARLDRPGSIFADFTWMGFAGAEPPARYREVFAAARDARDAAVAFIAERFAAGEPCEGRAVDDACRAVIDARGFGDYFVHRTGHSIGKRNHGFGVNLDNLETRDTRRLVPGVCCSVEPGIYIPGEIGVRTEIDIVVRPGSGVEGNGPTVEVTGPAQREIVLVAV